MLDYREDLLTLAHSTLHLKCKEAAEMGAKVCHNIRNEDLRFLF